MRKNQKREPTRPPAAPPAPLADRYLTAAGTPPPRVAGLLAPVERTRPLALSADEAEMEC